MKRTILFLVFLMPSQGLISQIHYPFGVPVNDNDIAAYWYNVPKDSLTLKVMKQTLQFQSTLEIYGLVPSDSFVVSAATFFRNGRQGPSRDFLVKKGGTDASFQIQRKGKFFKLMLPVEYQPEPPTKIIITINAGALKRTKEIVCRYHTLSGRITDFEGKPFRAAVLVRPDDFDSGNGVWSDASGNYSILLPERIYSNIIADDESYGIRTAEAWGWHIIVDADQRLDFKVGTAEVYNLNVWPNNGGAKTYFLSFRPMSVFFYRNMPQSSPVTVDGKAYDLIDVGPHLKPGEIIVRFNGKEAAIVSLQKYYEWISGKMMPAYLLQVSREGLENVGKQTVTVEYRSEGEVRGEKVVHSSMGVFQFYVNFTGLSFY